MYYQQRRDGRYYLRPVSIDHQHEATEISEDEFYGRWRRIASLTGDDVEPKIAETKRHSRDVDVL